jgi:hypothetical protein
MTPTPTQEMGQEAVAQHIEDGLPEIVEPAGATMLEIAQTLQGATKAEWRYKLDRPHEVIRSAIDEIATKLTGLFTYGDGDPPMTTATPESEEGAGAPRRRRSRSELRELGTGTGETVEAWLLIEENVSASNDRDAIDAAIAHRPDDERVGMFCAPRNGVLKPRTWAVRPTPTLVWE